jgi:endonuclease G
MPRLSAPQQVELLDLLLELPATRTPQQREALLFSLPPQITDSVDLSGDRNASLVKLIETLDYWGQLTDGRWAMEVMLRNAQRAARNTQFEQRLEAIRQTFELPAGKVQLPELPEEIVSEISYLMPVSFLTAGHRASLSVARVCVPQYVKGNPVMNGSRPQLGLGTGWLIAPSLLVTNHHVVEARFKGDPPVTQQDIDLQAHSAQAWFNYVDAERAHVEYRVARLEAINARLDYAVLRLVDVAVNEGPSLREWGFLDLASEAYELRRGVPLNIIQHPAGDVKQVAIRRNDYIGPGEENRFYYLTDTLPGSSGSPVFNDDWEVVGLHRASRTLPEKVYLKGETIKYNNVGVHIHAILRDLPAPIHDEIEVAQGPRRFRDGPPIAREQLGVYSRE